MDLWQRWLHHPERPWLHRLFFQIHYAAGLGIGLHVLVVSMSGGIIVYRNELSPGFAVEWLVKLHENLLLGETGRLVNGIGAVFLTLVCLTGAVIWWPGIKNWRRSLTVKWKTRFARDVGSFAAAPARQAPIVEKRMRGGQSALPKLRSH